MRLTVWLLLSSWALPATAQDEGPSPKAPAGPGAETADAGVSSPQDEAAAEAERQRAARERSERLERLAYLARGELPPAPLEQVVYVPLDDEARVRARLDEVRGEAKAARLSLRRLERKKGDFGEPRRALEEALEELALREKVLVLPVEVRHRLVRDERAASAARHAAQEAQTHAQDAAAERQLQERVARALAEDEERRESKRREAEAAAQRALDAERAQLEEVRLALETVRAEQLSFDSQRKSAADARETKDESRELGALRVEAEGVAPESAAADALYDRLVSRLREKRADIERQLANIQTMPVVPSPGAVSIPERVSEGLRKEREELLSLRAKLADQADALVEAARNDAWITLADTIAEERMLNALRISLLDRVSPRKHAAVLGIGPEGRAQLARELHHFQLIGRWVALSWRRQVRDSLLGLRSAGQIGAILLELSVLAFVFFAARRLLGAQRRLLDAGRTMSTRMLRSARRVRLAHNALSAVAAVYVQLVWLLAVLLAGWLLGASLRGGLGSVAYALALLITVYRLILTATHRFLAWAWTSREAPVRSAARSSEKILRSVQVLVRSGLVLFLALSITQAVAGRGYLYHAALRTAWLLVIPVGLWLVQQWTAEICDAYLLVHGDGHLAKAVRDSRKRWYGFAVALLAFGVLVPTKLVRWLHQFVLGFERSRKALAYLLRRRLEREAEESESQIGSLSPELPAQLVDALTLEPLLDPSGLLIDHFPELDRFQEHLDTWRAKGGVGATLVVGKSGFGKTSWLGAAERLWDALPCTRIPLRARTTDPAEVLEVLAQGLDLPTPTSREALVEAMRGGEPRLLVLDDIHFWFERRPGGHDALDELAALIGATSDRVYWLCSMSHYPFRLYRWATAGATPFRQIVQLPAWSESKIGELIAARLQVSKLEVSYEELLVDAVEGVDMDRQVLSTARDYNRLVWDYADGSPRAAIDVFRSSLTLQDENTIAVRLFRAPSASELEGLLEPGRFALAGLVWHAGIGVAALADSLRIRPAIIENEVRKLLERGVLCQQRGLITVTVSWWPVVIRFLKRKHLVSN